MSVVCKKSRCGIVSRSVSYPLAGKKRHPRHTGSENIVYIVGTVGSRKITSLGRAIRRTGSLHSLNITITLTLVLPTQKR